MKASNRLWKDRLTGQIAPHLSDEIDQYEHEILLKKQGKVDDKVFADARLRRGVYGQRYDNGFRHDGIERRKLAYSGEATKGPSTVWDAPGMQRIKIPFGGLNASQLETIAELSEEYSVGVAHVTTRQDFQLHFIHLEDTPTIMRRLAAVGITTREACGNTVRNVTGCPLAGVCREQAFDVTPYAKALAYFLLGHPDTQDFGRKFKVAFSGCDTNPCALVHIHDFGCIARVRNGVRGFEVYVGGGLGTVPYQAKLYDEFVSEAELLPLAQSIGRVFARLGEKKNRNAARLKFLVAKLGIEEFKRLVTEERATLDPDPRWSAYLTDLGKDGDPGFDGPLRPAGLLQIGAHEPEDFRAWRMTNVYRQRQPGYATVTITLPLGDITADQLRAVAAMSRKYVKETIRTTVEQDLVLRWVSERDLPALYAELKAAGLGQAGAGTILEPVACPGTDTCKLGISSSRGLAAELRVRLAESALVRDEEIRGLRIKVSGCFNSCGQHHIADLGFYGVSRNKDGYSAPHFQVVLGGQWGNNAGSYGLAIGAIPSKRVPEAVERITARFAGERQWGESFQDFIRRIGKSECKRMLEDLTVLAPPGQDPSLYTDWRDVRKYSVGDMGVGECAGEVVSRLDFQLAASEREAFEAQLAEEAGDAAKAAKLAYQAMLRGAKALLEWRQAGVVGGAPDDIVAAFRREFYDTQLFFDPFAGGKFAHYFFGAHKNAGEKHTLEQAHRLIEEAQLFIECCHSSVGRISAEPAAVKA